MKKLISETFISLMLIFLFTGCLKDLVTKPDTVKIDYSAQVLTYLESRGDYINSDKFPSLVEAQEVYNNLSDYLIIDVRSRGAFSAGHIQNAVNVQPDSLLNFMKSNGTGNYSKVIIVSGTGQAASYFSCLLILDGYSNIYVMKYGMASWNSFFASPWQRAVRTVNIYELTKNVLPKSKFSPLPSLTFPNDDTTIELKVEDRIGTLLKEGFDDEFKESYTTPVTDFVKYLSSSRQNIYLLCLGDSYFYGSHFGFEHPIWAVNYIYMKPELELESVNYLQTIPPDKTIYLYSYAGHVSAAVTAYLRVLGYNAISILYGGNNLIHSPMLNSGLYNDYTFVNSDINDFPYTTGK